MVKSKERAIEGTTSVKEPRQEDIVMGSRIRQLRKMRELSQEQLGDKCGITFQQIQKYEKGTNRLSFSRMVTMAHALEVSINDLVPPQYRGTAPSAEVDDMLNTATVVGRLVADFNACSRPCQKALIHLVAVLSGRQKE